MANPIRRDRTAENLVYAAVLPEFRGKGKLTTSPSRIQMLLLDQAFEVDRLSTQLQNDAENLAERLAQYGARLASEGLFYSQVDSTPFDYSHAHDFPKNAARLGVLRKEFARLFFALSGREPEAVAADEKKREEIEATAKTAEVAK